jgi:hypothetical protein
VTAVAGAAGGARAAFQLVRTARREPVDSATFWKDLSSAALMICRADAAIILRRGDDGVWAVVEAQASEGSAPLVETMAEAAGRLAERVLANGHALEPMGAGAMIAAAGLDGTAAPMLVAVLLVRQNQAQVNEAAIRLQLIADIPVSRAGQAISPAVPAEASETAGRSLVSVLDMVVTMVAQKRFVAAAMALCNDLAAGFGCARVSLGWQDHSDGRMRLRVISHIEQFEARTEAVGDLESVMEEAVDQGQAILYPDTDGTDAVTVAHLHFQRRNALLQVLTLVIDDEDGEAVGAVVCERTETPFSEADIARLSLLVELSQPWLAALERRDPPFKVKLRRSVAELWQMFLHTTHTKRKLAGVAAGVVALVLLFGRWPHEVEAPVILKTDQLVYLPAPFEGYIDKVEVKVGDIVEKDSVLLDLDTAEMLLKESEAESDIHHYARAADKARAQGALADLLIAQAQAEQAQARLDRLRYYLSHASIRAPFDGIVVEGERKELLGAPVKKGDVLFKLARLEDFFIEMEIDERDVQDVTDGATGEISFLTRTDQRYPIRIDRVQPMATVKPEVGNVFVARARFIHPPDAWWRPGMSGLARIDAPPRSLPWLLFHRTFDFLRLHFWL